MPPTVPTTALTKAAAALADMELRTAEPTTMLTKMGVLLVGATALTKTLSEAGAQLCGTWPLVGALSYTQKIKRTQQ